MLKNFLQYVMTNEAVDEFTEEVARQIVAVKNDPIAMRDFMVLATRIKDAKRQGFIEGHAAGLAEGIATGEAQGEVKKSKEMVSKCLRINSLWRILLSILRLMRRKCMRLPRKTVLR